MTTLVPLLLFAVAGFLLGGAYSLHRQGKPRRVAVSLVVCGVLCGVLGGLYL